MESSRKNVFAALVATVVCMLVPNEVSAHGYVSDPPARQICNGKETEISVTVSGGNGGRGHDPVQLGGMPGICGDPFQAKEKYPVSNFLADGMICEPQAVWKRGQDIEITVALVANHGGFFEFRLCDQKEATQACFDKHLLMRSDFPDHADWHILSINEPESDADNPDFHTVKLKLPDDVTCDHCVVQMTWWTAHHCIPVTLHHQTAPCDKEVCGIYADLRSIIRPDAAWPMDLCPKRSPSPGEKPQIFRNCVDVAITDDGNPGDSTPDATPPATSPPASAPEPSTERSSTPAPSPTEDKDKEDKEDKDKEDTDKGRDSDPPAAAPAPAPATYVEEDDVDIGDPKMEKQRREFPTLGKPRYKEEWKGDSERREEIRDRREEIRDREEEYRGRREEDRERRAEDRRLSRRDRQARLRLLLNEKLEEADQANVDNMSGAGMLITCKDTRVEDTFDALNELRREDGISEDLMCSNRATGVAENFAEMMCQQGHVLEDDPIDLKDNCHLSKFDITGTCEQVVTEAAAGATLDLDDLKGLHEAQKKKLLNKVHKEAGLGYSSCGGKSYWTILFM